MGSAAIPDDLFPLRPWSGTLDWLDPRDIDGGSMVGSRSAFEPEQAPCGKVVAGDCYRDTDGEGLVVYDLFYACGCRRTRHEYHDGTVNTKAIRHGRRHKVLSDEHSDHPV
jgi:hypothetical protein